MCMDHRDDEIRTEIRMIEDCRTFGKPYESLALLVDASTYFNQGESDWIR